MPPQLPIQTSPRTHAIRWVLIAAGTVFLGILGVFLVKLYQLSRVSVTPDGHVEEFQLKERDMKQLEASEQSLRDAAEEAVASIEEKKKTIEQQFEETKNIPVSLPPAIEAFSEGMLDELPIPGGIIELNPR